MTLGRVDRIMLGWSREQLAQVSGVSLASVYLFERMGTAGLEDDARIRNGLAQGKVSKARVVANAFLASWSRAPVATASLCRSYRVLRRAEHTRSCAPKRW